MATTKKDIREWLERAESNHSHMIVVCDTFDYDDYPVYVKTTENCQDVVDTYQGKSMQRVMEVYNLSKDTEAQLKQQRAWSI